MEALKGLRVLDLAWIVAGSMLTRYLADHGATVIKVESATRPDLVRTTPPYRDGKAGWNRSVYHGNFSANKLGMTLNLSHPQAREVARRLLGWAEVVVENFTPGVMDRLGLGYEQARQVNPSLIMLSISSQGQTGPHAHHPGVGLLNGALLGFFNTGWPDRETPIFYGAYLDVLAPRLGVAALMAALDYRDRTGQGQHLDLSQLEVGVHFLAPLALDYFTSGREPRKVGNADEAAAPHNAYPCAGDNPGHPGDRWCAIACFSDDQWQALAREAGHPEWAQDSRFITLEDRKRHEAELDELVASWTRTLPAYEVMERLQRAGVPAGVVADGRDLHEDPQLRSRGHFTVVEHPETGPTSYDIPGFRLSLTPGRVERPAPCLGEHTEGVLREVLGLSDQEFAELLASGALD